MTTFREMTTRDTRPQSAVLCNDSGNVAVAENELCCANPNVRRLPLAEIEALDYEARYIYIEMLSDDEYIDYLAESIDRNHAQGNYIPVGQAFAEIWADVAEMRAKYG